MKIQRGKLKHKIIRYLSKRHPEFVPKAKIKAIALNQWHYDDAGRQCREMENWDWLEKDYYKSKRGSKCVQYRLIPEKLPEDLRFELGFEVSSNSIARLCQ